MAIPSVFTVVPPSCAEHIGVAVPGASKFTNSAPAETLGIYGVSFACSTETCGIGAVTSTTMMTSMV